MEIQNYYTQLSSSSQYIQRLKVKKLEEFDKEGLEAQSQIGRKLAEINVDKDMALGTMARVIVKDKERLKSKDSEIGELKSQLGTKIDNIKLARHIKNDLDVSDPFFGKNVLMQELLQEQQEYMRELENKEAICKK